MERIERNSRNLVGFILILIGLFLIGRNVGLFSGFIENVIFSWQMLLVVIGFVILLSHHNRTTGLILMSVGGFFLLPEIFNFEYQDIRLFWPALLIIVGLLVIFRRQIDHPKHPDRLTKGSSKNKLDIVNFFSGAERQFTTQEFEGGKVTSVFGGGELDFTDAGLAEGENVLDIVCVFGGVSLIVPDDWDVVVDVVSIFGGFSDKRKLRSGRVVDPTKQLIIKGIAVFGGGELKSYK